MAEEVAIIDTEEAKVLINQEHGKEQNIKMKLVELLQQGQNPFDIICYVAEYLEKQSAERGYAQHVKDNIRTIYGIGLGDKKLLADEIADVEARAEKLRTQKNNDGFTDEQKSRMDFAIKAHERMIELLKKAVTTE